MASISARNNNGYRYYDISESFRKDGKPHNRKTNIGRFDTRTGAIVIKDDYVSNPIVRGFIESQKSGGRLVYSESEAKRIAASHYSYEDIRQSTAKSVGGSAIVEQAISSTGVGDVLASAVGGAESRRILAVASYLVMEGGPMMYCRDFAEENEGFDDLVKVVDGRRISELFKRITTSVCDRFFRNWMENVGDGEQTLALDITSVSTWSRLMGFAGWGYNRDGEDLEQVNYCLVCSYESGLPFFWESYQGELKDISTLENMVIQIPEQLRKNLTVVTDKGFPTKKCVVSLMHEYQIGFLFALPFTMQFSKDMISLAEKTLDEIGSSYRIGNDILRMTVLKDVEWPYDQGGGSKVNAFVYRNDTLRHEAKKELDLEMSEVHRRIEDTLGEPDMARRLAGIAALKKDPLVNRYFDFRKKYKGGEGEYVFTLKKNAYDSMRHKGYVVIVSNRHDDPYKVIGIYRDKDIVEKGHNIFKNRLGFDRLRIHGGEKAGEDGLEGLRLVAFVALVIYMWITRKMDEAGLFATYTLEEMFRKVSHQKVHILPNGEKIVSPPTASQKEIYKAMGVKLSKVGL